MKEKEQIENEVLDEVVAPEIPGVDDQEKPVLTAADLIKQQAAQSQYIEKLEAILMKEDVTEFDLQNIEFCRAQILSQLVGVVAFSEQLKKDDERAKAAAVLEAHLSKVYAKVSGLKEKVARKHGQKAVKDDLAENMLGANKTRTVTDEMLMPHMKDIQVYIVATAVPLMGKIAFGKMVSDSNTRLASLMPSLLEEFNRKTSVEDKAAFTSWADMLTKGLNALGNKKSMQNALAGVDLSKVMSALMGEKGIS